MDVLRAWVRRRWRGYAGVAGLVGVVFATLFGSVTPVRADLPSNLYSTLLGSRTPIYSGGSLRSMGTRFTTTAAGYLYGVRYWHTAADTQARTMKLWRNGNFETEWAVSSPIGGTARWVETWFGAAYPLESGNTYTLSMDAREGWVIQCCTTPNTVSGLSSVGSYYGAVGAFPNNAQDTTGTIPDEGWSLIDVLYGQVQQAFSTATAQAAATATAGAGSGGSAPNLYANGFGSTTSSGLFDQSYRWAVHFTANSAVSVAALRYYGGGLSAGTWKGIPTDVYLFDQTNSGAQVGHVSVDQGVYSVGWHEVAMTGVTLTVGHVYEVMGVWPPNSFMEYATPGNVAAPPAAYSWSGSWGCYATGGTGAAIGCSTNNSAVAPLIDVGGVSSADATATAQAGGTATAQAGGTATAQAGGTATAGAYLTATAAAVVVGSYATATSIAATATAGAGAIQTVYAGQLAALQTQAAGAASAQQTTLANAVGTVQALQTQIVQATATPIPTATPLPGYLYTDPALNAAFATMAASQATMAAFGTVPAYPTADTRYQATMAAAQATMAVVQVNAEVAQATIYAAQTVQAGATATTTPIPYIATIAAGQAAQVEAQPTSQGILAGIQAAIEAIPNGIGTAVAGPLQPLATVAGQWQVQATATGEPGGAVVILRQTVEPVWATKTAWIVDAEATVTGIGTTFTTAAAGKSDCGAVPNLTTTLHLPGGSFSVTLLPGWAMGIICAWRPVMAAIVVCFSTFFWIRAGMRQWANLVE